MIRITMNQIISTRDFGRKGITPTPWIGDVIILFALSVVVMMVSHFILKEALYTSISSAFFFFCILGLLVFLAGGINKATAEDDQRRPGAYPQRQRDLWSYGRLCGEIKCIIIKQSILWQVYGNIWQSGGADCLQ